MRKSDVGGDGPKICDQFEPTSKDTASKAHKHNFIKRGIPPSPQRLLKSLGSWKNQARARESQNNEVATDGFSATEHEEGGEL